MKTALQLGHELTNETQQAITEAISARDLEVRAATLREAAELIDGHGCWGSASQLRELAERAERGEP